MVIYEPVVDGVEAGGEQAFALRKDPLRMEMFKCDANDGLRLDWQAPKSICVPVFEATVAEA